MQALLLPLGDNRYPVCERHFTAQYAQEAGTEGDNGEISKQLMHT